MIAYAPSITTGTPTTLAGILAGNGGFVKAVALSGLTFDGTTLTAPPGGVSSFNTRTGAVSLTLTDVVNALAADMTVAANSITATAATGGAAGNSLTLAGSAAAVGSGLAGGNIILTPGAGDGAGAAGMVVVRQAGGTAGVNEIRLRVSGNTSILDTPSTQSLLLQAGTVSLQLIAGSAGWNITAATGVFGPQVDNVWNIGTATSSRPATIYAGTSIVGGLIFPQQAPTVSAPTYAKGALYFDTTLNKLRVGGATAWETVTSS